MVGNCAWNLFVCIFGDLKNIKIHVPVICVYIGVVKHVHIGLCLKQSDGGEMIVVTM